MDCWRNMLIKWSTTMVVCVMLASLSLPAYCVPTSRRETPVEAPKPGRAINTTQNNNNPTRSVPSSEVDGDADDYLDSLLFYDGEGRSSTSSKHDIIITASDSTSNMEMEGGVNTGALLGSSPSSDPASWRGRHEGHGTNNRRSMVSSNKNRPLSRNYLPSSSQRNTPYYHQYHPLSPAHHAWRFSTQNIRMTTPYYFPHVPKITAVMARRPITPIGQVIYAVTNQQGSIVFPDDGDDDRQNAFAPSHKNRRLPPSCAKDGSTYCESVADYPLSYLSNPKVISLTVEQFRNLYGEDVVEERNSTLSFRIDLPVTESSMCAAQEQIIFPQAAQNKDRQWLYVVNHDEYKQGILVEKCLNPDRPCAFEAPAGYQTICRQKYIYRRLMALGQDGETVTDSFRLPSCCACYVKAEFFGTRIAGFDRTDKNLCSPEEGGETKTTSDSDGDDRDDST